MALSRRHFLVGAAGTLLGGCGGALARAAVAEPAGKAPSARSPSTGPNPFLHGVASGDPLHDRVLLWTRVSTDPDRVVDVEWQCAQDASFSRVVAEGRGQTDGTRDHTFVVDASGLAPGGVYHYRFHALGWDSPPGRTRTLPRGQVAEARFAAVSCANYARGYFNGYGCLAERDDLDAVLHLGDYLYEYHAGKYPGEGRRGRVHVPDGELLRLRDYRRRYAQYRSDPDLQAVHAAHPFICVWDDHETANNSWRLGAENHNPERGEGTWHARLSAAVQAYHEWLPVRHPAGAPLQIQRRFQYGDLVDLFMLDGRIVGRDQPLEPSAATPEAIGAPERTMLGEAQERWLYQGLRESQGKARWRLLGQQTMMGQLRRADGSIGNPDQWDGYPAARQRLFDVLAGGVDNVAVLSGDIHSSWAVELSPDPFVGPSREPLAVELICPGISSPSPYGPPEQARRISEYFRDSHPHVKYQEGVHRGYTIAHVTRDGLQASWHHLPDVSRPARESFVGATLHVEAGNPRLLPVSAGA